MLARCPLAGTEVALVVQVYAVAMASKPHAARNSSISVNSSSLQKKAAMCVVADVFRALEFRGWDHFQRNCLLFRKCNRIGKLGAGQTGRVGDDRQHILSERLMRGPGEVGGIHSAGVGDESASKGA
jgi:hypothetical protein